MPNYHRYAIYLLPEGPLAEFGASWLGWDILRGVERAHPDIPGLPAPAAALTATPRRYGFHATIKPPFRLAPGRRAEDLREAVARLAARRRPEALEGLAPARMGRFLALRPVGDASGAGRLAASVVRELDPFRAPPQPGEVLRRRRAGLTRAQDENLLSWGYPYVMDEFQFHITLTGPLEPREAEACLAALTPAFAPLLPRPLPIDRLSLVGSDAAGRFHLVGHYRLTGA